MRPTSATWFRSVLLTIVLVIASACSGDDGGSTTAGRPVSDVLLLSGQGNDLVAYRIDAGSDVESTKVITNAGDDPEGRDINGQVCFLDEKTFVAGEDTGQPEPPAGFGLFTLTGEDLGDLEAEQIGKLTPPFPAADSQPEPYGCAVLSDGRMVTTDVGNQAAGPGTGQLIIWFSPKDGADSAFCVVDDAIATAQQVAVDGDDVLVASARPPTTGVWRYTDLPTGPTPEDGCSADRSEPAKELFIEAGPDGLAVTNGVTRAAGRTGWYVSSVISGVINEYDDEGTFVRQILAPPAGEELGTEPFSTGTPLGLAVGRDEQLYYADIGIVFDGSFGPGDSTGSIRRIDLAADAPGDPETLDDGLAFPDSVSLYLPNQR